MNTHDKIELPPLPADSETPASSQWEWSSQDMRDYALAAIEPYQLRIEELEAELQELRRQWVEHDTLGCPTAKTGIYASKADRQRIADQFHKDGFYDGVILGLQAMAACGNAFNADYVELLRSAGVHETVKRAMKEGLYELAGLDSNASEDLRKEIDSARKEFTQKIIYGGIQNEHT